jgi:FAD:protein FMN transferase
VREPLAIQSRLRVALGTFVAIEAEAGHHALALQGIESAFAAILTVQQLMHPIRGSDLAALSACPPGTPLKLHRWTWEVLELCKQLHTASGGIFDPCLGEAPGRLSDLQLLPDDSVIARAPLHIDLGGIAKGYAVDRAIDALRAAECVGGLVNAGGDLAVFGDRSHGIACGGSGAGTILLELRDAALATSNSSITDPVSARRPAEHRGYYDGRGHHRSAVSGQATVIAGRAAVADGLTKCLLAMPGDIGAALLDAFGARQIHYPPVAALTQ